MQKLMGYMRRAMEDYHMVEPGDRIAVGVSGGKDSVALLTGLSQMRRFYRIPYELTAITLDPQFGGTETDYREIELLCRELGIPYLLKRTRIGQVVFDTREESNPCSLCARMRRGALHDATKEAGCNKIALGHHMDDAVETFLMNLFQEGRIGCFSPVTYLSRKDITMIRPMVYAPEAEIRRCVNRRGLPVVKSVCPVDGATKREWTKNYLSEMEKNDSGFKQRLFGAMRRGKISGW